MSYFTTFSLQEFDNRKLRAAKEEEKVARQDSIKRSNKSKDSGSVGSLSDVPSISGDEPEVNGNRNSQNRKSKKGKKSAKKDEELPESLANLLLDDSVF